MKQKDYIKITGAIFLIVALFHAARLLMGWQVIIGGFEIPMWLSFAGVILAGYLAYSSWNLKK